MKTLFAVATLATAAVLSACSTAQPLAQTPSFTIHNPGIYATQPPLVDDGGVPLAMPVSVDANGPAAMARGTGRMAD